MKLIIIFIGVLICLVGVALLFDPEILFGFMEYELENSTLYLVAIIARLVFGVLFIVSANQSRYPTIIKVLGAIAIIAALIFILMGRENFYAFISNIIIDFKPYGRMAGVIVIAFGGFLIYAFSGKKES